MTSKQHVPRGSEKQSPRASRPQGLGTELTVRHLLHKPLEIGAGKMHQRAMIAALEVDVVAPFEALVDDRVQPVGGRQRRHGALAAIGEKGADLLLGRKADRSVDPLTESIELNLPCGR